MTKLIYSNLKLIAVGENLKNKHQSSLLWN
jgi:hypothetical protein